MKYYYRLGETVEEPNFDERFWQEYSSGIHFFVDRKAAVLY